MNPQATLPALAVPRPSSLGIALALAGAICFSGKAILAKLMYQHGVDAVTVVAWRMLIALPMFMLLATWAGRGKAPLGRRDVLAVTGLGFCGYYASSMLDFYGLMFVSASPVSGSTLLTPPTTALKSRSRAPLTFGFPSMSSSETPGARVRMLV